MSNWQNRISPHQIAIWLIIILAIIAAPFLGYAAADQGLAVTIFFGGIVFAFIWTFTVKDRWWVPFPAALVFSGSFWVGFSIPAHELALLICILPLILSLMTRWTGPIYGRTKIAPAIHLLTLYLVAHWIGSLTYNGLHQMGGGGNVTRRYMTAFWPLILFYFFYFFGKSQHLKQALILMYLAAAARVGMGVFGYFAPGFYYIPGINYILPAGNAGDLRTSGLILSQLSLCFFFLNSRFRYRFLNFNLFFLGAISVAFGGGRGSLIVLFFLIFFWTVIYRKPIFLLLTAMIIGVLVGTINSNPEYINSMPPNAQRTLSILLISDKGLVVQQGTSVSDRWHARLMEAGRKRWLESAGSIFVGNGVRPFDSSFWDKSQSGDAYFESMLEIASQTGSYESGLWTVLAIFGAFGLLLYANTFYFLLKGPTKSLLQNRIVDQNHAFYFMALFQTVTWIVFCWGQGSFPSLELMLALLSKAAYDDAQKESLIQKEPVYTPLSSVHFDSL